MVRVLTESLHYQRFIEQVVNHSLFDLHPAKSEQKAEQVDSQTIICQQTGT